MGTLRTPFRGVGNILRFNWHFYVIAAVFMITAAVFTAFLESPFRSILFFMVLSAVLAILTSLILSWYIYDWYPLYAFNWIQEDDEAVNIINIHAGLDETSIMLRKKFPKATITIMDFYDPAVHTEVSIKRARKRYPPLSGTRTIQTTSINFSTGSADKIFLILSAHEIRNNKERVLFFKELKRLLKPDGNIYIMEHLRNFENFMAYTIGFLHFHSYRAWRTTFRKAGLPVIKELNQTPFIKVFELKKNGVTG
ncbi:methyltransferase [Niabella ginsenosidivorans]|uniref:Methyltransferase n=2 Tax=Niabella ginsenosidivorans TaxID=1176587 RepID=A0A1A9I2V3_9BACT|nr:methyltransferase [Niabella ginsenosidivorans]